MKRNAAWLIATIPLLASTGRAQTFLWELDSDPATDVEFGYRVLCIGDVDSDGCDDFVVADPYVRPSAMAPTGAFFVYSGKSRSLIWSLIGTESGAFMGEWLARLSDIDGDGKDEFAVTSETNHVDVFSSGSGGVLYSIPTVWGWFGPVANAGDVDADGVDDVLVGNVSKHALAYSGRTGSLLHDWPNAGGQSVASAGDVNGDGYCDVLVGNGSASRGGFLNGCVFIYSGWDGSLLHEIDGMGDGRAFGASVRGGRDLDGDGIPDFLIATSPGYADYAYAYSGATNAEITRWSTSAGSLRDGVAEFAGDIDKDGAGDVFLNDGANVELVSSRPGLLLYQLPNLEGSLTTGDVDGDGLIDLLIGEVSPSTTGSVAAWSAMIPPRVTGIQPSRSDYRLATNVTVTGSMFLSGSNVQVSVGGSPATNVVVVDDSTITCTAPPGSPGPADVVVQDNIGSGTLAGGYVYTPAVLWSGDASLGGKITIEYQGDPFDGILALVGLPPQVNIPTPPFHGELCIAPFKVLFVVPTKTWPYDSFWLSGTIPNDPGYSGVQILLQALIGPSFSTPKDATWTNCSSLTVK